MWKCKKCGREFANKNQSHFCSEQTNTVDEYIAEQPEEVRERLLILQEALQNVLPDAIQKISWRMPTFWKQHNIIHFAAFKKHIGIYPGEEAIRVFADRLQDYPTSKGAIQFPYDRPLPVDLICEIAIWCYTSMNQK